MKKSSITIRSLTIEDIDTFFSLFTTLVTREFPEFTTNSTTYFLTHENAWSKERYKKSLTNNTEILLGAWDGKKLVGLFHGERLFGGVGFGPWIGVHKSYRGRGIGKKLLHEWEQKVLKLGGHSVYLYAGEKNVPFYEKMGYSLVGVYKKGWFGADYYMVVKQLAEPKEENYLK